MFFTLLRRFLAILLIPTYFTAAYWSVRLAKADLLSQKDSIESRLAATDLTPGDAKSWIRLAHLQEQRGRDARNAFTRATQVNPYSAEGWIGLGLEQELAGDLQAAEKSLLHAAELSREYVPRSSLANFYFRRNDPVHFWPWAKQALAVARGDQQSIFRMCWGLSSDAAQIAKSVLPDNPVILQQYLVWLSSTGKLEAAEPIATRVAKGAGTEAVPAMLFYCNMQISQGYIDPAKAIWDQLLASHLIPGAENAAETGLVNGRFLVQPLNSGLDWRFPVVAGVSVRPTFPGLRVAFSGKQPESCAPLLQYVPMAGGRPYKLWYEYQTTDIPPGSGLSWRIYDPAWHVEFTKDPASLANEKMGQGSVTFSTPAGTRGGLIVLSYSRAPGTTRISGWLQLKKVGLQAAD